MKRGTVIAMTALAAIMTVGGLAVAQDDQAPPPLIFDEPPPPQEPPPPTIEAPPPVPSDMALPTEAAETPPAATPPAPVDVAAADKEDEEEAEEDAVPPAPLQVQAPTGKRLRHGVAIIQALDKITAETIRFEARVNVPVKYRGLVFTVRTCETSSEEEAIPDSIAYLQIRAEPRTVSQQQPSREVFRGWMFASSPGLNPLQHPVYDAWVIACKA
jgi:hypothetical protein